GGGVGRGGRAAAVTRGGGGRRVSFHDRAGAAEPVTPEPHSEGRAAPSLSETAPSLLRFRWRKPRGATADEIRMARPLIRRLERDVRHAARPYAGAGQARGVLGAARAPAPARGAAADSARMGDGATAGTRRFGRVRRSTGPA